MYVCQAYVKSVWHMPDAAISLDQALFMLQALIRKYMPIAVILGTVLLLWLVKKFFFSLVG